MSFRFKIDGRYRDCRSRFMLAQRVKSELTQPTGLYRWITNARPNTLLQVCIMGDTFNVRAYKIPHGAILSPKGMSSPIKEFYRENVSPEMVGYIRRHRKAYDNDKACVFYVVEGDGDARVVRELEFVEFNHPPEREDLCLDLTVPLCDLSVEFTAYLK